MHTRVSTTPASLGVQDHTLSANHSMHNCSRDGDMNAIWGGGAEHLQAVKALLPREAEPVQLHSWS